MNEITGSASTDNYAQFDPSNPRSRLPVILLLDISGSMGGAPINELNAGVRQFLEETALDARARASLELEIITFNDTAQVVLPFQPLPRPEMIAPFVANGQTAMGGAIRLAENDLRARQQIYRQNGNKAYKPCIILITDGEPNDNWQESARSFREMCERHKYTYFAVGVGNEVNMGILNTIVPPDPGVLKLYGVRFREMFNWLTDTLTRVTHDKVDTNGNNVLKNWLDDDIEDFIDVEAKE